MKDYEPVRMARWRIRWALFFLTLGAIVAMIGEPQPLAFLTGIAGFLTGAIILFVGFERPPPS